MSAETLPPPPPLATLLAGGEVALFLDFDGTLVEIASGPDAIEVSDNLAGRLETLAARVGSRLALVSGRGLDNIDQHIGVKNIARAGSHGAERLLADGSQLGDAPRPLEPETLEALKSLSDKTGALLERKAYGAALHYRAAPETGPDIESAARAIAALHGLSAKSGKCVVELLYPGADKGGAVSAFMAIEPFVGSTPVFLGDDVTDEDGFAKAKELGGFGIAVGERQSQNADFRLDSVCDVYEWLEL